MAVAMQTAVEQTLAAQGGHCIAIDNETGKEYSHKWRGGPETRVYHVDEENETEYDFVFRVRVDLVAIDQQ
jgi:hypothetical protein